MPRQPRIAVVLDENTSGDGRRYEAAKGYFRGIRDAGGAPLGIPYFPEMVRLVLNEFDGVLSPGGRFAYPDDWYAAGEVSKVPPSERFDVERAIVEGCLERSKPILGICAGMQMIACLHGCRLTSDLGARFPAALDHEGRDALHSVRVAPDSRLASLVGKPTLLVNSFHREAILEVADKVIASAHAEDGVIEAIEAPSQRFAVGLQWHQELFAGTDHPGNAIFAGLVEAAGSQA